MDLFHSELLINEIQASAERARVICFRGGLSLYITYTLRVTLPRRYANSRVLETSSLSFAARGSGYYFPLGLIRVHFHGTSPTRMKRLLVNPHAREYFFNKRRLNGCAFGSRAN